MTATQNVEHKMQIFYEQNNLPNTDCTTMKSGGALFERFQKPDWHTNCATIVLNNEKNFNIKITSMVGQTGPQEIAVLYFATKGDCTH